MHVMLAHFIVVSSSNGLLKVFFFLLKSFMPVNEDDGGIEDWYRSSNISFFLDEVEQYIWKIKEYQCNPVSSIIQ